MSIPPEPRDVPTCATDTIGELPPAAMDGGTNYQNEVAILRAQLAGQEQRHQAELSRVAMATTDLELAHESDVRELERRLAEAAELALRLSCEKGARGKALAEAQEQLAAQVAECKARLNTIIAPNEPRGSRLLTPKQLGALPMIETADTVALTHETFDVLVGHIDAQAEQLAEAQQQAKEQAEQLGDYQIAIDTAMVTMGQEDVSPGIVAAAQAMMEQLRQAQRRVADLTARLERAEGALRAVLPLAAAHHRHEAETGGYDPISGNWAEEAYQANAKAIAEATALAGQDGAKGEK